MIQITDNNYLRIIEDYTSKGNIVVAMSGSPSCINCKKTMENIKKYQESVEKSNVVFVYMNNTFDFALESAYQMEVLNEYPKSVIYFNTHREFIEGEITFEDIELIERSQ